jgi:hypothetical protein
MTSHHTSTVTTGARRCCSTKPAFVRSGRWHSHIHTRQPCWGGDGLLTHAQATHAHVPPVCTGFLSTNLSTAGTAPHAEQQHGAAILVDAPLPQQPSATHISQDGMAAPTRRHTQYTPDSAAVKAGAGVWCCCRVDQSDKKPGHSLRLQLDSDVATCPPYRSETRHPGVTDIPSKRVIHPG